MRLNKDIKTRTFREPIGRASLAHCTWNILARTIGYALIV